MGHTGCIGNALVYQGTFCGRSRESNPGTGGKRVLLNIPNTSYDDDRVRLFDETSCHRGDAYLDYFAVSGHDRGRFWSSRSLLRRTPDFELVARSTRTRTQPAEEVNHGSECSELSR